MTNQKKNGRGRATVRPVPCPKNVCAA
jgi:hypothetical protein